VLTLLPSAVCATALYYLAAGPHFLLEGTQKLCNALVLRTLAHTVLQCSCQTDRWCRASSSSGTMVVCTCTGAGDMHNHHTATCMCADCLCLLLPVCLQQLDHDSLLLLSSWRIACAAAAAAAAAGSACQAVAARRQQAAGWPRQRRLVLGCGLPAALSARHDAKESSCTSIEQFIFMVLKAVLVSEAVEMQLAPEGTGSWLMVVASDAGDCTCGILHKSCLVQVGTGCCYDRQGRLSMPNVLCCSGSSVVSDLADSAL
jgi:hypothetical protein